MSPRRRRFPEWILPTVQIALEIGCALGAFLIACRLWLGPLAEWRPVVGGAIRDISASAPYLALLPFIPLIRLAVNWHAGLHERRGTISLLDDLGRVFKAATIGSACIICFAFLYRRGFEDRAHSFSRMVFLLDWVLYAGSLYTIRLGLHRWQRWIRSQGGNLNRCILINSGKQAEFIRRQLADTETWGHRIVAELEARPSEPQEVSGVLDRLPDLIRLHRAHEVIVSDPTITYHNLVDVLLRCDPGREISIRVVPDLRHFVPSKVALGRVGNIPTLSVFDEPIQGMSLVIKRAMDVAVAGFSLILLSPVLIVTAIAIKLESPGPVFFRQERVGRDGRKFWFFKFRSMHIDCDESVHRELVSQMIAGNRAEPSERDRQGNGVYKLRDDPRVTRVGRFIRRHSIDELPQLFNVLLGDMSLVGPRPPIAYEVSEYSHWHRKRLSIRPGITGLWQIMGRSKRTYNQMVKLDIFYIEHWSLWLDLRILLKTLRVVLRGSDAY
ncbi:sugar transferase [Candidatus Sumerlaeota bacterium]|nr:sugar transferase [Candidatus Sumerlaeota bacterium]